MQASAAVFVLEREIEQWSYHTGDSPVSTGAATGGFGGWLKHGCWRAGKLGQSFVVGAACGGFAGSEVHECWRAGAAGGVEERADDIIDVNQVEPVIGVRWDGALFVQVLQSAEQSAGAVDAGEAENDGCVSERQAVLSEQLFGFKAHEAAFLDRLWCCGFIDRAAGGVTIDAGCGGQDQSAWVWGVWQFVEQFCESVDPQLSA